MVGGGTPRHATAAAVLLACRSRAGAELPPTPHPPPLHGIKRRQPCNPSAPLLQLLHGDAMCGVRQPQRLGRAVVGCLPRERRVVVAGQGLARDARRMAAGHAVGRPLQGCSGCAFPAQPRTDSAAVPARLWPFPDPRHREHVQPPPKPTFPAASQCAPCRRRHPEAAASCTVAPQPPSTA